MTVGASEDMRLIATTVLAGLTELQASALLQALTSSPNRRAAQDLLDGMCPYVPEEVDLEDDRWVDAFAEELEARPTGTPAPAHDDEDDPDLPTNLVPDYTKYAVDLRAEDEPEPDGRTTDELVRRTDGGPPTRTAAHRSGRDPRRR